MKVAFISDIFLSDGVIGGAELVNDCLINRLRDRGYEVDTRHSHTSIDVEAYDFLSYQTSFIFLKE